MQIRVPPKLKRLATSKQRRLDELLDKNSEGRITPEERTKLEQLVAQAEQVMVENARRLANASDGEEVGDGAGAVAVTVWVKPEHTDD